MRSLDSKFHIIGDEIVKSSNAEAIPLDEPLFLLRARDLLAIALLLEYRRMSQEDGCNEFHFEHLDRTVEAFRSFREQHPERMKQASITKGR